MLRHRLDCVGTHDTTPAPTTGTKHQSKRRKTEGSDSQNGSPGLGAQPEEFGDESELEGSQPSSSYNEPPAAQPYDMDDYGNQSFATQAGENRPMLSHDPEGRGFSQEKQVEGGDQEEQSIQGSGQERSIGLDMADATGAAPLDRVQGGDERACLVRVLRDDDYVSGCLLCSW